MKAGIRRRLIVSLIAMLIWLPSQGFGADDGEIKVSRVGAGTPMPSFTLPSLSGAPISSAQLAGKIAVLNFWATWCGPCKDEMPALDRLSRRFDPRDVAILTITTDHDDATIRRFMQQVGSTLPVLLDEQRDVSLAFLVRGLPTTILVGKRGHILGRAVGPRAWDGSEAIRLIEGLLEADR